MDEAIAKNEKNNTPMAVHLGPSLGEEIIAKHHGKSQLQKEAKRAFIIKHSFHVTTDYGYY